MQFRSIQHSRPEHLQAFVVLHGTSKLQLFEIEHPQDFQYCWTEPTGFQCCLTDPSQESCATQQNLYGSVASIAELDAVQDVFGSTFQNSGLFCKIFGGLVCRCRIIDDCSVVMLNFKKFANIALLLLVQ